MAELHTHILKERVFVDWHRAYPDRLQNVTNGITPRRWLGVCNPELTALLSDTLGGDDFLTDLARLGALREHLDDALMRPLYGRQAPEKGAAARIYPAHEDVDLPENFLYDVQVKRLHEYKRQLMNALSLVDLYNCLKEDEDFRAAFPPVAVIFGAKAAAGYDRAKSSSISATRCRRINGDPR